MWNIIYLASGKANLKIDNVVYNDYIIDREIKDDMINVDLTLFDLIVATPPCNYWSRANCNINSEYSQKTKYLLPLIIWKCIALDKPFIIENVINKKRMKFLDEVKRYCYYQEVGRHCYFTSHKIDLSVIPQKQDFKTGGVFINKGDDRQGGSNVNNVLEYYIKKVIEMDGKKCLQ